jgi:hypothetical protein
MTNEQSIKLNGAAFKAGLNLRPPVFPSEIKLFQNGAVFGAEWMEQNQWIPVEQGLPEEHGEHEVTIQQVGGPQLMVCNILFSLHTKTFIGVRNGWQVTAWRERPTPYSSPKQQTNE